MTVRLYGDNPQTLASGLSTLQTDKQCSILFVARVDLAHYGVSRAKDLGIWEMLCIVAWPKL